MGLVTICEHTFFGTGLNSKSVIIDAGANFGNFSRGCMERFGCLPYALEANPQTAACIVGPRVFPVALSAKSTELEFFIGENAEGCSTFRHPDHTTSVMVKAVSLEDFLREQQLTRIDLLKIDIEGAELDVLSALSSIDHIAQASVEFHDFMFPEQAPRVDSVISHMSSLGFDCYNFSSPGRVDVLFVNPELLPVSPPAALRARTRVGARHLRRVLGRRVQRPTVGLPV